MSSTTPNHTNTFRPADERLFRAAAAAILTDDHRELHAELSTLAVPVARRVCSRLAHRGATCDCSLVHSVSVVDSALPVAHAEIFKKWGTEGAKGRPTGVRLWLEAGAVIPFLAFDARVLSGGRQEDCLRSWNVERSLPAKSEIKLRLAGDDLEAMFDAVGSLPIAADEWDLLGQLNHRRPYGTVPDGMTAVMDPRLWIDGLFTDACQPAHERIDAARLARWMSWESTSRRSPGRVPIDDSLTDIVGRVADRLDTALGNLCPELHARLLDRPRQQTRSSASIP